MISHSMIAHFSFAVTLAVTRRMWQERNTVQQNLLCHLMTVIAMMDDDVIRWETHRQQTSGKYRIRRTSDSQTILYTVTLLYFNIEKWCKKFCYIEERNANLLSSIAAQYSIKCPVWKVHWTFHPDFILMRVFSLRSSMMICKVWYLGHIPVTLQLGLFRFFSIFKSNWNRPRLQEHMVSMASSFTRHSRIGRHCLARCPVGSNNAWKHVVTTSPFAMHGSGLSAWVFRHIPVTGILCTAVHVHTLPTQIAPNAPFLLRNS